MRNVVRSQANFERISAPVSGSDPDWSQFVAYVRGLTSLIHSIPSQINVKLLDAALDGQPAAVARQSLTIEQLRNTGAFFTGSSLARRAVAMLTRTISADSIIVDPTSGAGDLLIACSEACPVLDNLSDTIQLWGQMLTGRELQGAFVSAAKARLILAAIRRGVSPGDFSPTEIKRAFPQLRAGCALAQCKRILLPATHIVMNPPFTLVQSPENCAWATGVINAASLFVHACITHSNPGTRFVAILPDVLRSGSRYDKWRRIIDSRLTRLQIELLGQFDKWADVDVFILRGVVAAVRSRRRAAGWGEIPNAGKTISDYFRVSVGPVVPHRDPHAGPWRPFIQAHGLPRWITIRSMPASRRFAGRVVSPPFVVLRRTSRPGDEFRAAATIIAGNRPVAVENHLIILEPIQRTLRSCREVMHVLRSDATNDWLNRRIRCRHLTVSAAASIPWHITNSGAENGT